MVRTIVLKTVCNFLKKLNLLCDPGVPDEPGENHHSVYIKACMQMFIETFSTEASSYDFESPNTSEYLIKYAHMDYIFRILRYRLATHETSLNLTRPACLPVVSAESIQLDNWNRDIQAQVTFYGNVLNMDCGNAYTTI